MLDVELNGPSGLWAYCLTLNHPYKNPLLQSARPAKYIDRLFVSTLGEARVWFPGVKFLASLCNSACGICCNWLLVLFIYLLLLISPSSRFFDRCNQIMRRSYERTAMGGGNFMSRVVSYVVNELVVDTLANKYSLFPLSLCVYTYICFIYIYYL